MQPKNSRKATPPREQPAPSPTLNTPCTDLGNAERLLRRVRERLKYVSQKRKYLIFDGRVWRVDHQNVALREASMVPRTIANEEANSQDEMDELSSWAKESEGRRHIEAMVALAQPYMAISSEALDANHWVLNCENGTLDLKTGCLQPHSPCDLITKIAPVEYDAAAKCPLWEKFLLEVMGDDKALVEFLRRAVGYCLTGDVSEQVLFFLHGGGANGKSTCLVVLQFVLGGYAEQAPADLLLSKSFEAHPTEMASLAGSRMVVATEVNHGRAFDEARLKLLTGGDTITARRMREDFWSFSPTHKLWLAANSKPTVRGNDYAIWRRLLLVPFEVTFSKDKQDPQLVQKLKEEAPGILAWAVRGCREWRRDGLQPPKRVLEAVDDYRAEMDVLAEFIDARCTLDARAGTPAEDLYAAYLDWSAQRHDVRMTKVEFGQRLSERGLCAKKGAKGVRRREGIRLT